MKKTIYRAMQGGISLLVALLIAVVLGGCSKKEEATSTEAQEPTEGTATGTGRVSVEIVPEEPTVESELRAVVRGGARLLSFVWLKNGEPIEGATEPVLPPGSFRKGDVITVVVKTNGEERTSSVTIGNTPPEVTGVVFTPKVIHRGVDITVVPQGEDPDGDDVYYEYQWIINGEEVTDATEPVLKGDMFYKGDAVTVRVTPYDHDSYGEPFVAPDIIVPNAPPRFVSTPPVNFKTTLYTYQVRVVDPDDDPVSFTLEEAPDGMTIDNTGLIEWPIDETQEGTHRVKIIAEDGDDGKAYQEYTITISIQ